MREALIEHVLDVAEQANFEALHTAPAPVISIRRCACGHAHGGRYGVCLADGCDCVEVRCA